MAQSIRYILRTQIILFAFVVALIPAPGFATDLGNFSQVSANVYRSAEPSDAGLQELPSYGIRMILDLEKPDWAFQREKAKANALGIEATHIGLSPLLKKPSQEKLDAIIAFFQDKSNYPVLVHCKHGEDRTGMAIGLYRVFIEGVSPAVAYQEMLDHGFHPRAQVGLKCAFFEKTGMPLPTHCRLMPTEDED